MARNLPDINVWLAMTFDGHAYHPIARQWFDRLSDSDQCLFCRLTQPGKLGARRQLRLARIRFAFRGPRFARLRCLSKQLRNIHSRNSSLGIIQKLFMASLRDARGGVCSFSIVH